MAHHIDAIKMHTIDVIKKISHGPLKYNDALTVCQIGTTRRRQTNTVF